MSAKYYELRCMFKKLHIVRVGIFAWYSVINRVSFVVQFKRQKVNKKNKLHENWNMQTLF